MGASRAVVSDQAVMAWLARHRLPVSAGLGGVVVGEVLAYRSGGTFLNFWGMGFAFLFGVAVCWFVAVCVWWNRRRVVLARHKLPDPGPVGMWKARRLEARRVRYVHRQWAAFCTANGVTGLGKIVPKLHHVAATVSGDLSAVIMPGPLGVKGAAGMTAVDRIRSLAPSIAETCGCEEVLVKATGVGNARLTFLWTKPLERVLPVAQLPAAPRGQIVYGVRRDESAATITAGKSVLVSGMTGSGKSGLTWALLADLNRQGVAVDLYASDPKGGIELGVLANHLGDRTSNLHVVDYCSTADDTKRLIENVEAAMKERQRNQSARAWTIADAGESPLIVLVIDECIEVLKRMKTAGPATDKARPLTQLMTILSQGRASGVMVIASTQMAQKEVLGDVRDLFPQRLSLATKNSINTDMVLGDGAEAAGALCSKISDRPGLGYSYDEKSRGYHLFRAGWCTDEDIRRVAAGQVPEGMADGESGEPNRECAVYRFYTAAGELLYVGITVDLTARWAQHAADKPWWGEVHLPRTLVTWHPSVEAARRVESHEIRTRLPRYNKQHNSGNPLAGPRPEPLPGRRLRRNPTTLDPDRFPEPSGTVTPIDRRAVARAARRSA